MVIQPAMLPEGTCVLEDLAVHTPSPNLPMNRLIFHQSEIFINMDLPLYTVMHLFRMHSLLLDPSKESRGSHENGAEHFLHASPYSPVHLSWQMLTGWLYMFRSAKKNGSVFTGRRLSVNEHGRSHWLKIIRTCNYNCQHCYALTWSLTDFNPSLIITGHYPWKWSTIVTTINYRENHH